MSSNTNKRSLQKAGKVLLPLLGVLKDLKPEQRVILLAHLDDKTRDSIYRTITFALQSSHVPKRQQKNLQKKLGPFQKEFSKLTNRRISLKSKQKALSQVGGGPMKHILRTAVPVLLNIFR